MSMDPTERDYLHLLAKHVYEMTEKGLVTYRWGRSVTVLDVLIERYEEIFDGEGHTCIFRESLGGMGIF